MANIFKPTFTKPIPAGAAIVTEKGQRFARFKRKGKTIKAPLTLDGQRVRLESDVWPIRYKNLDGSWKSTRAYTDKRASESMALKLQERLDQRQEGVNPFSEHHNRPLSEHVADWQRSLEARGLSADEVSKTVNRVKMIVEGCRFALIPDLAASAVEVYLAQRRANPDSPLSAQTHNYYVQAFRRFCKWLLANERDG